MSEARHVHRDFARAAQNRVWVTDIAEYLTREGKGYCAVVLDVYSGRVVGWSIDSSQTAALATNALGMAISNRSPLSDTVGHFDHRVQGRSNRCTAGPARHRDAVAGRPMG